MTQKSVDERFSSHVCIPSGPVLFPLTSSLHFENEEDFCHFWIGEKDLNESMESFTFL